MKGVSSHERRHPLLGGIGTGLLLSMAAVQLAEVLSPGPRHVAVQLVTLLAFAVGGVLQHIGLSPKPSGGRASP